MSPVDVAIVGGGLVGCSAALFLRQRGASVVLLERGTCGSQASGVNYGGVRQQGRHLAELPLARRSRAIWARLKDLIGTDGEFMASGHLKLARSETEMESLENYASEACTYGLALNLMSARTLAERFPWLGSGVIGGSYSPEDGHANPRLVTPAFARAAKAAGADIREGVEVREAHHDRTCFTLHSSDGTTVRARRLINAAGAWGAAFAAHFGEEVPADVMAPNMCVTDPIPYFMGPNLGVCGGDIYIRQIPRGNVIFGAGEGIAHRDALRAYPLPQVTTTAVRLALALVPRLANAMLIRTWSGIEGFLPDRLPVISPSATTPGLIHAFGFSGHGFQLAPAVGSVLSELALDGVTPTPTDHFSIQRFGRSDTSKNANVGQAPVSGSVTNKERLCA